MIAFKLRATGTYVIKFKNKINNIKSSDIKMCIKIRLKVLKNQYL